jgi:hypothetical protein
MVMRRWVVMLLSVATTRVFLADIKEGEEAVRIAPAGTESPGINGGHSDRSCACGRRARDSFR